MQELEKILKEIDQEVKEYMEIDFGDEYNAGIKDMAKMAEKIIRKHMNGGWIPVEERLPEESLNSVIGWDEYRERCCFVQYYGGKWSLRADREPIKIIAWRPLPEPYRPENKTETSDWRKDMLRKFDRREIG